MSERAPKVTRALREPLGRVRSISSEALVLCRHLLLALSTHSILHVSFPSSLKKKDSEEESDTYDKKENDYGSTIGRFLGLQSNDYHPPKTDLKTKLLWSKKDPFLEDQSKNDKQKDQKNDVWKPKDLFRAIPKFKRPSYRQAPQPLGSHLPMVFPPQQSAPSVRYSDTGMDTKHKSLTPNDF